MVSPEIELRYPSADEPRQSDAVDADVEQTDEVCEDGSVPIVEMP